MKFFKFIMIISAFFTLNISAAVFAQDIPEEDTTKAEETQAKSEKKEKEDIELNTVVVTATKTEERIKDVPMNIDVISAKDIEATGATTLGDAIGQKVTGHFHRYSGASQAAGLMTQAAAYWYLLTGIDSDQVTWEKYLPR